MSDWTDMAMHDEYPWAIEELAAAIAMFSHANVRSTRGGRALREAMQALLNPTDIARETMARLGLEPYDADGRLRPLSDIIAQLQRANPSHGDYWRIFGIQCGSTMSQLVRYSPDTVRQLAARVRESEDAEKLLSDTRNLVGQPPRQHRSGDEAIETPDEY